MLTMRNFRWEKRSAIFLLSIGMLLLSTADGKNITSDNKSDLSPRKDTIYVVGHANMDMNWLFSS